MPVTDGKRKQFSKRKRKSFIVLPSEITATNPLVYMHPNFFHYYRRVYFLKNKICGIALYIFILYFF